MSELIEWGWLLALAPAAVLVRDRARGRRVRRRLNRSLHELRRPLQALALSSRHRDFDAPECFLGLAMSALRDLDHTVNGTAGPAPVPEHVSCRDLVVAAIGRWRAASPELELQLYWDAGAAPILAEVDAIAAALDNLIANAIEHGHQPLAITGCVISQRVRITLSDRGTGASSNGASTNGRNGGDPRRGHGLDLVSEVVAAHGGRFALSSSRDGTVAALELPLADLAALPSA